jgi:hypothetical protein
MGLQRKGCRRARKLRTEARRDQLGSQLAELAVAAWAGAAQRSTEAAVSRLAARLAAGWGATTQRSTEAAAPEKPQGEAGLAARLAAG